MMVYLRKGFSEEDLSRIHELIDARGKAMAMEPVMARKDDEYPEDPGANAGDQL